MIEDCVLLSVRGSKMCEKDGSYSYLNFMKRGQFCLGFHPLRSPCYLVLTLGAKLHSMISIQQRQVTGFVAVDVGAERASLYVYMSFHNGLPDVLPNKHTPVKKSFWAKF